jgi:hypothetical protein
MASKIDFTIVRTAKLEYATTASLCTRAIVMTVSMKISPKNFDLTENKDALL